MQPPKNITIQVWTDNYYCRVIGIWRPHEEPGATPTTALTPQENAKANLPRYIVLSSVYEPRIEVLGNNPIAPGQHPIPKEFLDDQTRQISYMFANDMGIFTPPSKQIAATFLAKQTNGYKMKKEIKREVRPANGTMTMKDLRDSLGKYSDEELEAMPVMILGENPKDADKRGLSEFIYTDRNGTPEQPSIPQYITVTKITPVYELEDPYISNLPITEDHIEKSLPPGTADEPMSAEVTSGAIALAETDAMNREALAVADEMKEIQPEPILDEDGEPMMDENGEPMMTEPPVIDRVTVLEELLKKKDQELIDAGIKKPVISTEAEQVPPPAGPAFGIDGQQL